MVTHANIFPLMCSSTTLLKSPKKTTKHRVLTGVRDKANEKHLVDEYDD